MMVVPAPITYGFGAEIIGGVPNLLGVGAGVGVMLGLGVIVALGDGDVVALGDGLGLGLAAGVGVDV